MRGSIGRGLQVDACAGDPREIVLAQLLDQGHGRPVVFDPEPLFERRHEMGGIVEQLDTCLLYTSDAADE